MGTGNDGLIRVHGTQLEPPTGLSSRRFLVLVGVTHGAVGSDGNPLVYMTLADALNVRFEQDKRALDAATAANLQHVRSDGPGTT